MLAAIIKKNIKEQFQENKALFVVFLICQLVSFLAFTYIHCHYQTLNNGLDVPDIKFSTLKMDVPQNEDFSYSDFLSQLEDFTENNKSETEYIALLFDIRYAPESIYDDPTVKFTYNTTFPFYAYAYGEKEMLDYYMNDVKYIYGSFFETDDLGGDTLSAIIADEFQPGEEHRLKNLTISGEEVSIIGQVSTLDNRNCIIPFNSAENFNLKPTSIVVKFNNENIEGSQVFYSYIQNSKDLEKYFSSYETHDIVTYNSNAIPKSIELYICVGILCLSIINFSYLYIYFLKKNKRNTDIYQICGCTQKKIKLMLGSEVFILNLIGYAVCILLYKLVLIPIIFAVEPLIYFNMNIQFIILNFVIINVLCYLVCYPFIEKYSVIENINKEY